MRRNETPQEGLQKFRLFVGFLTIVAGIGVLVCAVLLFSTGQGKSPSLLSDSEGNLIVVDRNDSTKVKFEDEETSQEIEIEGPSTTYITCSSFGKDSRLTPTNNAQEELLFYRKKNTILAKKRCGRFVWGTCHYDYFEVLDLGTKKKRYYIGDIEFQGPSKRAPHATIFVFSEEAEDSVHRESLHMMRFLSRFSDVHKLVYGGIGGVMLGFCRNGKRLYWDDDIDVVIKRSQLKIIDKIWRRAKRCKHPKFKVFEFEGQKYSIYKGNQVMPFSICGIKRIKGRYTSCVDFFLCHYSKKRFCVYGPTDKDRHTMKDYPKYDFCGVPFRFAAGVFSKPSSCDKKLPAEFGKRWAVMADPKVAKYHFDIFSPNATTPFVDELPEKYNKILGT